MAETPKSLVENVVNPSGFPFQLRIEHEIEMTSDEHRWRVVAREYHWIDKATRADGYIDIVLEHERARAVVECKRVKEDSIWVFLIPTPSPGMISRSRLLWASSIRSIGGLIGWDDLHIRPDSYQSAFCVVRGQSDKSTPMLERMSADVLLSLEGLATEELSLFQEQDQDRDKLYVPLIVTNAGLEVYHFDPKDIDLSSGKMLESSGQFESIPYMRFRKPLATSIHNTEKVDSIRTASVYKERTVFIVQSAHLAQFLKKWNTAPLDRFDGYPWMQARQQAEQRNWEQEKAINDSFRWHTS